jgi:hypothetical protein
MEAGIIAMALGSVCCIWVIRYPENKGKSANSNGADANIYGLENDSRIQRKRTDPLGWKKRSWTYDMLNLGRPTAE